MWDVSGEALGGLTLHGAKLRALVCRARDENTIKTEFPLSLLPGDPPVVRLLYIPSNTNIPYLSSLLLLYLCALPSTTSNPLINNSPVSTSSATPESQLALLQLYFCTPLISNSLASVSTSVTVSTPTSTSTPESQLPEADQRFVKTLDQDSNFR